MNEKWFGTVRWCNEDIAEQLLEMGIEPKQEYIDEIRCRCENGHYFTDAMVQAGWDAMEWYVQSAISEGKIPPVD